MRFVNQPGGGGGHPLWGATRDENGNVRESGGGFPSMDFLDLQSLPPAGEGRRGGGMWLPTPTLSGPKRLGKCWR